MEVFTQLPVTQLKNYGYYLAKDLKPGNHNREEGEFGMEVFELTLKEVEEKIYNGEIVDGKTICGIYLAKNSISS